MCWFLFSIIIIIIDLTLTGFLWVNLHPVCLRSKYVLKADWYYSILQYINCSTYRLLIIHRGLHVHMTDSFQPVHYHGWTESHSALSSLSLSFPQSYPCMSWWWWWMICTQVKNDDDANYIYMCTYISCSTTWKYVMVSIVIF